MTDECRHTQTSCPMTERIASLEQRASSLESEQAKQRADVDEVRSTHLEHTARIAGELTRIYKMLARIDRKLGGRR